MKHSYATECSVVKESVLDVVERSGNLPTSKEGDSALADGLVARDGKGWFYLTENGKRQMTTNTRHERFDERLYADTSRYAWQLAQETANANGAPVALLGRDGWLAICEEPPDDAETQPLAHGWRIVALIEPTVQS